MDRRSCIVHYGPHSTGSGQAGNLPLVANDKWRSGVDNILSMTVYGGTTSTYYYVKDHLGSVQAVVDNTGSIVEFYQYDAWGNVLEVKDGSGNPLSESAIGNRILWQGREYSWKTGFYYFRARWYEPVTGRWLSKDPLLLAAGWNVYAFCANNPVNFRDPTGLYWFRQPWQTPGVVGRDKTIVPPGGPVSESIEKYVPAGYTLGEMHDTFVGAATIAGFPDWLVNIPSMLPVYRVAQIIEVLRGLGFIEQPKPTEEPPLCK